MIGSWTSETVHIENLDGIAVVTLANPPVNGLGDTVRAGLAGAFEAISGDDGIRAVVIVGDGKGFCGGADVRQFNTPAATAEPGLRSVFAQATAIDVPVIAVIHGFALGGGLELALVCTHRIAHSQAKVGLTEVTLGLLPGAGGTQRLPRLIGAGPALELIQAGARISAQDARARGIVDDLFDGDAREAGVAYAQRLIERGDARPHLDTLPVPVEDRPDFDAARQVARNDRRAARAKSAAIDAVEASLTLPIGKGLDLERRLFTELVDGPESAALRHLFFAERAAARVEDLPKQTDVRPVDTAAVIGSGTMGVGIAMTFASAGIPVTLIDADSVALSRGLARVSELYADSARKGRLTEEDVQRREDLITPGVDITAAAQADLIVEAVFEDLDVKRNLFAELSRIAKRDAILATNTSRLDVDAIALAADGPARVIGTHFFSPANVMRLLEVVRGAQTSDDVLATVMGLASRIGKIPVLSRVCDGFIGNRMLSPYRREADLLLESGATPGQVDGALTGFGFAMGPFAMSDLAGLDIGEAGRQRFLETASATEREALSQIPTRLVAAGRLGQKTGAGYFRYEPSSRFPHEDPVVADVIAECAAERGRPRREVTDEEIVERCVLALVNEGAKLLDEGIAQRASDLDVVWVHGYGFPAFRGGPMHWAHQQGIGGVVARLERLEAESGAYWAPAPLLVRAAEAGHDELP